MNITKEQNRNMHRLLSLLGLMDNKDVLVAAYTQNRTSSSKEMTMMEAAALISYLKVEEMKRDGRIVKSSEVGAGVSTPPNDQKGQGLKWQEKLAGQKLRRKIIAMAHEMWWKTADGKADMVRINDWCMKFGKYKKGLNAHNVEELGVLVTQFEAVYKSYMKL